MDSIKDILKNLQNQKEEGDSQEELFDTGKLTNPKYFSGKKKGYVTKEYQSYGLWLANQLGDPKRATMYIKWAKDKPRGILESAYRFTIDYHEAKDKSRIFMWKVKELEANSKKPEETV